MEQIRNIDLTSLNISKISDGLIDYEYLMQNILLVDVSTDQNFRKRFRKFYRVYHVNEDFINMYFSLFEDAKNGKVAFEDVIRNLYEISNKVHFSFTSKMFHTLNDSLPIYDKTVRQYLRLNIYGHGEKEIKNVLKLYEMIKKWYMEFLATDQSKEWIAKFDELFPSFTGINPVKKIDFIIWGGAKDDE